MTDDTMTDDIAGIKCNHDVLVGLTVAMTRALAEKIDEFEGDIGTVVTASLLATAKLAGFLAKTRENYDTIPLAVTRAQLLGIFQHGFDTPHGWKPMPPIN